MFRKILLLIALIIFPAAASASVADEIASDPNRSGGIYYAYPVEADSCPAPPEGFSPVYISHYGRHGSRWAIKEWKYGVVLDEFARQRERGNLTPEGERVEAMVKALWADAEGNAGALTPMGERQHKAIAGRMAARFPALFTDSARVRVFSSVEPRCIVSMAAFCERLKELNPALRIDRTVSPGNMDFIAFSTPEAKAAGSDTAVWRPHFNHWRDSVVNSRRLMKQLFRHPREIKAPNRLMTLIHDIAIAEQNTTLRTGIMDIFTPDELFALWRVLNYEMYVKHACAPVTAQAGPHSARSLLRHIVAEADTALLGYNSYLSYNSYNSPSVTLRFGHDTNLIRLLALMGVEGCDKAESDPDRYHLAWQDFRVSPMGANLQLIFYRNSAGRTLVLLRHNERPVRLTSLPAIAQDSYFYDWQLLRQYFRSLLSDN